MTSVTSLLLFASCDPMTRKMLWKLKHILTLRNPRISEALPGETPQGSLELSADLQNVTLNLSRRWVTLVQVACLWQFFAIIVPVFEFQGFWNMRIISQTSRPKNWRLRHSGWSLAISLGIVWRQRTFGTNWRYDVDFFVRNTWVEMIFQICCPEENGMIFTACFKKKIIVEDDIHPNFRWSWSALWVALPGRVPSLRRLTLKQLQIPLPVSVLQLLGAVAGCGGGKVGDELCGASWRTCWKYYHSW